MLGQEKQESNRRRLGPARSSRASVVPGLGAATARPFAKPVRRADARLAALTGLASVEIETALVTYLSSSLKDVFGDTCDKALPIYFGPLLGRLYLEGL